MSNLFKSLIFVNCLLATPVLAQTNNACSLLSAHPSWAQSIDDAHEKWGIGKGAILSVIDQESRFKANASNGIYKGFSQASPQTWNWFLKSAKMGSRTRSDFDASAHFVGWHFKTMSKRLGVSLSNVKGQYLAYKLGEGGYRKGGGKGANAIAAKVSSRAAMFENQLEKCPIKAEKSPQ